MLVCVVRWETYIIKIQEGGGGHRGCGEEFLDTYEWDGYNDKWKSP